MRIENLPFENCFIVHSLSGGSNRKFYRVNCGGRKRIVMHGEKDEVDRYTRLAKSLREAGINVPEIYNVQGNYVLMEDLGDMSLYHYVKIYGPNTGIYEKVIDQLVKLQSKNVDRLPIFDGEKLFSEFRHFKKFYVPYARIDTNGWEEHIKEIVNKCLSAPFVPMHRDFQSKNIFIKESKIYMVDFQDMHVGPLYFDLASLLFDPYVMLQDRSIWELVKYYEKISRTEFDCEGFIACGILRIMQALGAFVRLSSEGKDFFKDFIRKGRSRLKKLLCDAGFYGMADAL